MSTTMTTTLGTSNLRSSSRQVRTNPTRTSRVLGNTLRQDSLVSNPPAPPVNLLEPHGFYPAIQHFADAITALPRDYRRHISLLKEVDAKAWAPEEHLQALLAQCLADQSPTSLPPNAQNAVQTTGSILPAAETLGAADNVSIGAAESASQLSAQSLDPTQLQRRQLYSSLRHTLYDMMVTMDEKNHVINNANEDLARHIRRLDSVYPHIAGEVSEEARLGSLKHWAYFETNISRKAHSSRREAAASLAGMQETEVAQRSENRREAMLAKRHRLNQMQIDSDFDEQRLVGKKPNPTGRGKKLQAPEPDEDMDLFSSFLPLQPIYVKKKKGEKGPGRSSAMGRSMSEAMGGAAGGRPMSRETSQQGPTMKKRKAPTSGAGAARKRQDHQTHSLSQANSTCRLNATSNDSPKIASSPLVGAFGKDTYKRSPIPSSVRPVTARGRQNSNQPSEASRARPSSAASQKAAGNAAKVNTAESQGESSALAQDTELISRRAYLGDIVNRSIERAKSQTETADKAKSDVPPVESATGRPSTLKHESNGANTVSTAGSPRLPPPIQTTTDRVTKGRASKTSTPVVGTFAESDASESVSGNATSAANGNGNGKTKRLARPRMKDHHVLQDSLSPKSLPAKRSHKKGAGSISQPSSSSQLPTTARLLSEDNARTDSPTPDGLGISLDSKDAAVEEDADNGDEGDDEGEERYCYCNGVSYGEMVACDNKDCKREWFHLACAGLKKPPSEKSTFLSAPMSAFI